MNTPKEPYGDVEYADPGYRDGTRRYPIDNERHVRAAWSYVNMPKNAAKYTAEQLKEIKDKIRAAAKKFGVEISDDASGDMAADSTILAVSDAGTALLASVAPLAPPAAWFDDPRLQAPTKLTITDDGRVFGHLAQWKVCHVGIGKSCIMAPKSRSSYKFFLQGKIRTDDGQIRDIGKITLGTGHAHEHWGIVPSREHYDNTGWAAAIVNIGEDKHGIWVSGTLTTTMTQERIAELRAAALSGDWREINGKGDLELIAALAVNNPGFPIYREQSGRAFSLMAVGVVGAEGDEGMGTDDDAQFGNKKFDDDEDMELEVVEGEEDLEDEDLEDDEDDDEEEDEDLELAARLERLALIDDEFEEFNQERRMSQLAMLDKQRAAIDERATVGAGVGSATKSNATSPRSLEDELFVQYNARFRTVDEE